MTKSNIQSIKQQKAFQDMDPEKQKMIELLIETLEGKKFTEALPVLTAWKQQMQQKGIRFTQEENQLLTEIFSCQLTPAQRKQFEYLRQFIK